MQFGRVSLHISLSRPVVVQFGLYYIILMPRSRCRRPWLIRKVARRTTTASDLGYKIKCEKLLPDYEIKWREYRGQRNQHDSQPQPTHSKRRMPTSTTGDELVHVVGGWILQFQQLFLEAFQNCLQFFLALCVLRKSLEMTGHLPGWEMHIKITSSISKKVFFLLSWGCMKAKELKQSHTGNL